MPERSAITQAVQIGVEVTPGTAVAATRRLGSIGFSIGPKVTTRNQRPTGQKYPTLAILGKEWGEAELEGSPVYTELPYPLASLMSAPTVVQILDGATPTGAYLWTFNSSPYDDDTPKTFTVEQGSSFRAHRVSNAVLTELSVAWSREEIELSGNWITRAIEDGITLTASPTSLPQVPVKPAELSVYLDTTAAGLGTTKLTRALKGEFTVGDRFAPLWVVDAALPSFATTIEGEPKVEFKMTQMADAAGMASLISMRNGSTRFLRLEGVGPVIYTGGVTVRHKMTFDVAGQVSDVSPFSDEDGVFAVEWTFTAVVDPVWGKAYEAKIITNTVSL